MASRVAAQARVPPPQLATTAIGAAQVRHPFLFDGERPVRMLSWLFRKKAKPDTPALEGRTLIARENSKLKPAGDAKERAATPPRKEESGRQALANPEDENLRRWRESGQARAWVEARQGCWNHDDWLALLEELKGSSLWPMKADAVGLMLEETKREWLRRN
jgi:hypothetical protein